MKFSKASIALLLIHLAIVSTVAAKYLYQRSVCPRVWTRANAYDPSLVRCAAATSVCSSP
jgi:hypothetical protein